MEILTGDIVRLKKKHPCMGCGHQVMVSRKLVEKNIRRLERNGEEMKITR